LPFADLLSVTRTHLFGFPNPALFSPQVSRGDSPVTFFFLIHVFSLIFQHVRGDVLLISRFLLYDGKSLPQLFLIPFGPVALSPSHPLSQTCGLSQVFGQVFLLFTTACVTDPHSDPFLFSVRIMESYSFLMETDSPLIMSHILP